MLEGVRVTDDKRPVFYGVDVYLVEPDDEPAYWSAEGGLEYEDGRAESSGSDFEGVEGLADLVANVVDDASSWANRYEVRFRWRLDGDEAAMAAAACKERVELPTGLPL